jgi:putative DNA primase/helicase
VSQIGWHAGIFVFPDISIGPEDSETVLFHSEVTVKHKYQTSGTLAEWRERVGRYCRENSRLTFAASCAFAAALLELVKADNCGFNFFGLSSLGKTTLERVSGSIWGGDQQADFLETWRKTSNGMEASAGIHNDALLCLDEIGEVNEREVGEIVYALGNGAGKGRMTRHITNRAPSRFRLLYLSTGEQTLRQIMQKAGKSTRGGQEARLVDIEADAGKGMGVWENTHGKTPRQFSDDLSRAARTHYGTPIRAFIHFVAAKREAVERDARGKCDEFLKRVKPGDSGEVGRVAGIFGLIFAAGEIATREGITGWKVNDALWAADKCFHSWIQTRGGTGPVDIEAGIRAVRSFVQVHSARFRVIGAGSKAPLSELNRPMDRVLNQAGWKGNLLRHPRSFRKLDSGWLRSP